MRESASRSETRPAWSQREGAPVLGAIMPMVDQAQNFRPHKSQSGVTIRLSDLIGLEGSPGICILDKGFSYRLCMDQTLDSIAFLKTAFYMKVYLCFVFLG